MVSPELPEMYLNITWRYLMLHHMFRKSVIFAIRIALVHAVISAPFLVGAVPVKRCESVLGNLYVEIEMPLLYWGQYMALPSLGDYLDAVLYITIGLGMWFVIGLLLMLFYRVWIVLTRRHPLGAVKERGGVLRFGAAAVAVYAFMAVPVCIARFGTEALSCEAWSSVALGVSITFLSAVLCQSVGMVLSILVRQRRVS